jgi:glycosyltransferase involved in cell wall biosynthesis
MIEAMACGTPVIAFPEGSAHEALADGETGFIVDDEEAMARAAGRLDRIDPARCRQMVFERFDDTPFAAAYEGAYEQVRDACLGAARAGVDRTPMQWRGRC